jgi:glycosyltransferase involved in cell wall biosynthesis
MERINNKRREGGRAVFKVGIAGKVDPVIRDFMEPFTNTKSGWLDVTGYLPHDQAISLIKSAGCLLLLHPDHKWWVPGKVAEYLVSGKPILAVIGEGELKELLNGFGQVLISRDELEEVGQNIEKTMDLRDKPRSIPPELTARGQAQIMADIIRKMTAQ